MHKLSHAQLTNIKPSAMVCDRVIEKIQKRILERRAWAGAMISSDASQMHPQSGFSEIDA